ncbi:hypothetical protein HN51_022908, partial [Arachis hypogaea]
SLKPGHQVLKVEGSHLLAAVIMSVEKDERELLVAVSFGLAASEAIKRWEAYAQQIDEKEEARDEDDDGDDDVQWQTDTSIDAARQRIQEQLSAVTTDMVMLSTNEPEKKKKKTESKGSENGDTVNYATVVRKVKAYLKKGVAVKELQSHIAAFPVSAQEKMNALLEGLFDGVEKAFGKEATKRKNHLAAAVPGDDEGLQLLLLNAVEEFCYKKGSNALNEVALILKALYDVDLVEEEHVVHWYSKGLKGDKKDSQIWKNAQPFIDWLRNAESESEEDEKNYMNFVGKEDGDVVAMEGEAFGHFNR